MLYSVLFRFGHIRRSDQCAVYILYSKISTDPGLLKIRHSHRFVAVVIQFLIPLVLFNLVKHYMKITRRLPRAVLVKSDIILGKICRYVEGVLFLMKGIRKGAFSVKMAYKRERGPASGRSLPV